MRLSPTLLPLVLSVGQVCAVRVSTWNVRYDSQPDNITVAESIAAIPPPLDQPNFQNISDASEQPWSRRRLGVAQYVASRGVSILGIQEALIRQLGDLKELLGNDWEYVGVGRDDGGESGEFSPILWNKKDVQLVSNDTFWLSDTPDVPSKFPDAGGARLVTAAKFNAEGTEFSVLNTHFDDISDDQRKLGASMLLVRAKFEAYNGGKGDGKVFVIGDFNSPSTGDDSAAYEIATGQSEPVSVNSTWEEQYKIPDGQLDDFKLLDLRGEAPPQAVSKNFATYTSFAPPNNTEFWKRIDFVFGGSNKGWNAQSYLVDHVDDDEGLLLSDHRPTIVDLDLGSAILRRMAKSKHRRNFHL